MSARCFCFVFVPNMSLAYLDIVLVLFETVLMFSLRGGGGGGCH